MNKHLRLILTCVFCLVSALGVYSQSSAQTLSITKGTTVVPKFEAKVIDTKFSVWTGAKNIVQIEQKIDGRFTLNGSEDWKGIVPLMSEFEFDKIERKKEYAEVKLKGAPRADLRGYRPELNLRFGNTVKDLEKAFQEIVFVGTLSAFEKSDHFKKEVIDVLFPVLFRGALSKLDLDTKLELMRNFDYNIAAISSADFKGDQYLAIKAAVSVEYNSLRVNQAERIARVIEEKVLLQLREIYKTIGKLEGLKGIKVSTRIAYRNFLEPVNIFEPARPTQYDELEIYAPLEEIAKFHNADITSQELVDKSVVLVNGNRVAVSLTQFSN